MRGVDRRFRITLLGNHRGINVTGCVPAQENRFVLNDIQWKQFTDTLDVQRKKSRGSKNCSLKLTRPSGGRDPDPAVTLADHCCGCSLRCRRSTGLSDPPMNFSVTSTEASA